MLSQEVNYLPGMQPNPAILPGMGRNAKRRMGWLDPEIKTVCEAHVYRKDVIFKVKPKGHKAKPRTKERGEIKGFSAESARRLRHLIRNTDDLWTGTLTLTYPGPSFGFAPEKLDGPACKRHIHAFCTWLGRKKIAYVWVLEFQQRGVPHFHFCLSGFIDKKVIAQKWFEIVGSGDPRHLAAGTRIEGIKNPEEFGNYMGSYVSKLEQKTVPEGFAKVGRFWGASRCLAKTLYRMQGLYRDVSRELRVWRRENQGIRRGISFEQLRASVRKLEELSCVQSDFEKHRIFVAAKRLKRRSEGYAKRWKWKGYGFILIRGANSFRSIMRQAVAIDRGLNPWKLWDGKGQVCKYESPLDRVKGEIFDGFNEYFPEIFATQED